MSTLDDGGPAFPCLYPRSDEDGRMGMTLRDYFAAKAMQAITTADPKQVFTDDEIARDSYKMADAMLKARENRK